METPLFIPFNIRNKIINENCTGQKDVSDFSYNQQYELLSSYMSEKQIYNGINNRIGKIIYSKARANFNISNSIDAFKKGQVTTRYNLLRKYGLLK